jgi:SAM-dependent methyltransferase
MFKRQYKRRSSPIHEYDFNIDSLKEQETLEKISFWYRGRKALIVWALSHYFQDVRELLEIGSGTGFVLCEIKKVFSPMKVLASDRYIEGLKYIKKLLPDVSLCQMDARNIPFNKTLDVIALLDVLEHIDEDERVLEQVFQAIQPFGGIILTVPQHPFLWSYLDEFVGHKRRYTRKELLSKIQNVGFSIVRVTSFGTLVFPLKLLEVCIRYVKKTLHIKDECIHIVHPPKFINNCIHLLMKAENCLISRNFSFSFGSSLLIVAKRVNHNEKK